MVFSLARRWMGIAAGVVALAAMIGMAALVPAGGAVADMPARAGNEMTDAPVIEAPVADEGSLDTLSLSEKAYRKVIKFAEKYEGWDYVWGGKFPEDGGFDCSGLVTYVYNNTLDTKIDGMMTNAEHIYTDHCNFVKPENAQPGDLVFWRGTYGSDINYISHVGIYCGEGMAYAAGSKVGYCRIEYIRNIDGKQATHFFGSLREAEKNDPYRDEEPAAKPVDKGVNMHRLYNRVSHEHLYTADAHEAAVLVKGDWTYEGIGWVAPTIGNDVYRLYNPKTGAHLYTTSANERNTLAKSGWNYEGVCWKSGGTVPMYRQCHPTATIGAHNFTADKNENDTLVARGWRAEGIAWYALRKQ